MSVNGLMQLPHALGPGSSQQRRIWESEAAGSPLSKHDFCVIILGLPGWAEVDV